MPNSFALIGALASIWIVLGIVLVAFQYPGYSHINQFCSELGAKGSPTQKLSPLINNYPLGILFIFFGIFVAIGNQGYLLGMIVGAMIILHGIGTSVAGFFPMDKDPYISEPSLSFKIHVYAGVLMLLSLLIAQVITALESAFSTSFRMFALLTAIGTIYFGIKLRTAVKLHAHVGVYQRLSYGCQLLWLFVYSIYLAFH